VSGSILCICIDVTAWERDDVAVGYDIKCV